MLDQIARLGDVCLGPLPLPLLSSLAALGETGSTTTEATATVGNLKQRRHCTAFWPSHEWLHAKRAGGRAGHSGQGIDQRTQVGRVLWTEGGRGRCPSEYE